MNDSLCPRQNNLSGSTRLCRAAICLLAALCFFLGSATAQAASGCDPKVLAVQTATALARVAADKAMDDEVNGDMPSSVLDLTCFDQAAAFSAKKAGAIFSGDFSQNDGFKAVMNDALKSMESNFADSIVGQKNLYAVKDVESIADGSAGIKDFNCDTISKLWGTVNNSGVKMNVPFPTFNDLLNGANGGTSAPPTNAADPSRTAGTNYQQSWGSTESQGAFTNLQTAMAAVKPAVVPSFKTNASTNTPINTPCQVMQQAMPSITCP